MEARDNILVRRQIRMQHLFQIISALANILCTDRCKYIVHKYKHVKTNKLTPSLLPLYRRSCIGEVVVGHFFPTLKLGHVFRHHLFRDYQFRGQ